MGLLGAIRNGSSNQDLQRSWGERLNTPSASMMLRPAPLKGDTNEIRNTDPLQAYSFSGSLPIRPFIISSQLKPLERHTQFIFESPARFYPLMLDYPKGDSPEHLAELTKLAAGLRGFFQGSPILSYSWDTNTAPTYYDFHHRVSMSQSLITYPQSKSEELHNKRGTLTHETMHGLYRDRNLASSLVWQSLFPLFLEGGSGKENFRLFKDAIYQKNSPIDVGHPEDDSNEAFASSASAYVLSADQLIAFIQHPDTPKSMKTFGKLIWCYLRDEVFNQQVFTSDGKDPFAGCRFQELAKKQNLGTNESWSRLFSAYQSEDPKISQIAADHLFLNYIPLLYAQEQFDFNILAEGDLETQSLLMHGLAGCFSHPYFSQEAREADPFRQQQFDELQSLFFMWLEDGSNLQFQYFALTTLWRGVFPIEETFAWLEVFATHPDPGLSQAALETLENLTLYTTNIEIAARSENPEALPSISGIILSERLLELARDGQTEKVRSLASDLLTNAFFQSPEYVGKMAAEVALFWWEQLKSPKDKLRLNALQVLTNIKQLENDQIDPLLQTVEPLLGHTDAQITFSALTCLARLWEAKPHEVEDILQRLLASEQSPFGHVQALNEFFSTRPDLIGPHSDIEKLTSLMLQMARSSSETTALLAGYFLNSVLSSLSPEAVAIGLMELSSETSDPKMQEFYSEMLRYKMTGFFAGNLSTVTEPEWGAEADAVKQFFLEQLDAEDPSLRFMSFEYLVLSQDQEEISEDEAVRLFSAFQGLLELENDEVDLTLGALEKIQYLHPTFPFGTDQAIRQALEHPHTQVREYAQSILNLISNAEKAAAF